MKGAELDAVNASDRGQRMMAQFALAGSLGGLVIGTDDAAEAVMGFFTKCGDRAADLLPLADLTTRRECAVASHLGARRRSWSGRFTLRTWKTACRAD